MKIRIKLKSPLLLGSGEGWGTFVDTDIVFDEYGLPYFPGKRLKGMLRESAEEVIDMFRYSQIDWLDKRISDPSKAETIVETIFGKNGFSEGIVRIDNLYLKDYEETLEWIKWAVNNYGGIVTKEDILETMTEVRQHTSISSDGIAKEKSLRSVRVLKDKYEFEGDVGFDSKDVALIELLALACANLRHVGSKRTRGFGEITCSLCDSNNQDISESVVERLKEVVSIV
jgi:CRISPR-associated protein Csx10